MNDHQVPGGKNDIWIPYNPNRDYQEQRKRMSELQKETCDSCGGKWVDHQDAEVLCKLLQQERASVESLREKLLRSQEEVGALEDEVAGLEEDLEALKNSGND